MILSFLIVFFHPISTLFLILILLSPALTDAVLERRGVSTPVRSTYVTVFIAVGIVAWMITFERITRAVGSIAAFYLYGSTASIAENQFSAASSGLTTQQTLNRFIELYGSILFLGLASGLCLMIVLYRFMSDKESLRDATAATHFILGCLVGVIMVFGFFLAKDPVRVSRYMVFGGILLSGTVLSSFHSKQNSRLNINYLLLIVLVLVLLVTSIPLALMGVYNPNYHLAESEYEGTGWVVNHHEDGKGVMSYRTDRKLVTYADTDTVRGGGLYPFRTKESPKRLGYGDNETINETLTSETPYLATKNRDTEFYRAYYRNQWPRTIEYTDDDIHRLRNDRGAKKLYTNGGFQLWRGQ